MGHSSIRNHCCWQRRNDLNKWIEYAGLGVWADNVTPELATKEM
jgi:hypothetical protein